MKNNILFLLPYPLGQAPSQRFRVEAFFSILQENNLIYTTDCFLNQKAWDLLYKKGSFIQKVWAVLNGFFRRLFVVLFIANRYSYIFIHREAAPLGPPFFEWVLKKILGKKIIFDFDDAIWIPNATEANRMVAAIKCFWKTKYLCKWAYKVSAGNDFLAQFAEHYNNAVTVIPTCVDTNSKFNETKNQQSQKVVIGWTGSHSTLRYLDPIYPVLQKLEKKYSFQFLIICDQKPDVDLIDFKFIKWKGSSEVEDLLHINIGIMPLVQDPWSEGKCGFKIIQYLALGIPAVASPVGVNKKIIKQGSNGFLSQTDEEWEVALETLLTDVELRINMGRKGREKIIQGYSIAANKEKFLSLFY